ncbi:response regulator transcription factor [Acuticoccus sediminis]|uniref:response regulator transcription factor n=1 Tax=Acuticoccus sediminis TaxID=2184697 RepID=UPI001CFD9B84|nr:response regulator transcription factor [Acuticoccus sediminis]
MSSGFARHGRQTDASADTPLVIVVDDDASLREALTELLATVDIEVLAFATTDDLLAAELPGRPGCILLDVRMPGSSGLDLQASLIARGIATPIVFLTAYGDVPMSVQAMRAGALDFLLKPVRDQVLLDAVAKGIARDRAQREEMRIVAAHIANLATLTPRERQVFREVADGRLNKQIAYDLGISDVTVKLHRGNVMRKMGATTAAELIRIWERLPAAERERGS